MKRGDFINHLGLITMTLPIINMTSEPSSKKQATVQLIRHATLLVEISGLTLLVDPMLSPKDAMDPVSNAENTFRIPMVELPFDQATLAQLLNKIDAVLVTHTHRDHWDKEATGLIGKEKPVFCQPQDEALIRSQGFVNVTPVIERLKWKGLTIFRTGGQHGTGDIGKAMGDVSGFVLQSGEDNIYIAGDTIWCEEVREALLKYKPKHTVLNTGGARFLTGDPITMTPADVIEVHQTAPETKIIAVHMDTVNHCLVARTKFRQAIEEKGMIAKVIIPADGEVIAC